MPQLGVSHLRPAFGRLGNTSNSVKANGSKTFKTPSSFDNGAVKSFIVQNRTLNLCWPLIVTILEVVHNVDSSALRDYYQFADNLINNNGLVTAIKVLKGLNTVVRKAALGQTQVIGTIGGIWFDCFKETGVPKSMPNLHKLISSNPLAAVQIVNTYTALKTQPDINLSTVESPYMGNLTKDELEEFDNWLKTNVKPIVVDVVTNKMHFSLNAGPNNKISLLGILQDLFALRSNDQLRDLFVSCCDKIQYTKLKTLYEGLCKDVDNGIATVGDASARIYHNAKLAFLSDKGGKTRVIYILSWWFQELLHPLHVEMMNWLSRQPQDATYRQREIALQIKDLTKQGKPIWAFDLTAATDRWPVWHQKLVVKALGGSVWADVWFDILTQVKPWVKEVNRYTSYEVGQPMGAYASWSALSASHHLLLRYLADKSGVKPEYFVLGDDLLIYNKTLASAYLEYMEKLGVQISLGKSYTYDQQKSGSSAEFAKYIFLNGLEYTPVSPILLQEIFCHNQWWKVVDLLKWMRDTCGITCVTSTDTHDVFVAKRVLSLIGKFNKADQEKILTLITYPDMVKELKPLYPTQDNEMERVPDLWKRAGEPFHLLALQAALVSENLATSFQALMELQKGLTLDTAKVSKDLGLESKSHPIWSIVDDLSDSITTIARKVDTCDQPRDAVNLLTDVKLLYQVLVLGKGIEGWERNNRSRFLKTRDHLVLTINVKLHQEPSHWYYDDGEY